MLGRFFARIFGNGSSDTPDGRTSTQDGTVLRSAPILKESRVSASRSEGDSNISVNGPLGDVEETNRVAQEPNVAVQELNKSDQEPNLTVQKCVEEGLPETTVPVSSLTQQERSTIGRLMGAQYLSGTRSIGLNQREVLEKMNSFRWSDQAIDYWKDAFLVAADTTRTSKAQSGTRKPQSPRVNTSNDSGANVPARNRASIPVRPQRESSIREAQTIMSAQSVQMKKRINQNELTHSLNDEQQRLFDFIESTSSNVFITGRAGSGKSFLLKYLLGNSTKKILPIAYMGVAALNIGGSTIHSAFGLPTTFIHPESAAKLGRDLYYNQAQTLRKIDAIVVDEISMVSGDMFQAIDLILREVRETEQPFGGVQMLLFGDPYQLPPIVSEEDIAEFYADNWGSEWFFSTPAWKNGNFLKMELQTAMRQSDSEFLSILDSLRIGQISFSQQEILNSRVTSERDIPVQSAMRIAGIGIQADSYNNQRLARLPGTAQVYKGTIRGNFERNLKRLPAPMSLSLKVGAQVLMVKNDSQDRWVNGTLGIVAAVERQKVVVSIDSYDYDVDVTTWKKYRHTYNRIEKSMRVETVAEYSQYPVDLGWARTIHKSQGQTFEKCVVDLNRGLFEKGQAYVAMSRCKTIDGLFLTAPLEFSSILSSDLVHEFMSDLTNVASLPVH